MVVVYRPDIDKYIKCDDKYWFKTLKKVLPENHLKRESQCGFSIIIKGVKFIVTNDWSIDNTHFESNTAEMIKRGLWGKT